MSDNKLHATSWTEIEYPVTSKNPFIVEPIFEPKDVRYILCRTNGERVESRLSFAVFNTLDGTEDDWEDDPMLGHIRMQVLGDGDEEVENLRHTRRNHLSERIDVVRIGGHHFAVRMGVEITERQPFHVLEKLFAQT